MSFAAGPSVMAPAPDASTGFKPIISIRRSGAIGDALAASCVADKLAERGFAVQFQAHPGCHPALTRQPNILSVTPPNGHCSIDLDGAYENDPLRTKKHFSQMFVEAANRQLNKRGIDIGPAINCSPRIIVSQAEVSELLPKLKDYEKPWVFICPRSNSFVNRTVPDHIWAQAAVLIQGTCFWLGMDSAPPKIFDLEVRHLDNLIKLLASADILVSVDTGPMHIACALNIPVVAIEQQSSPQLHLSDQRDYVSFGPKLDCLNCQLHVCPINAGEPPCQNVSPYEIADTVNARLRSVTTQDVTAVIAVYKPSAERLNRCLTHVLPQVQEVVIAADLDTPWPLQGIHQDAKIKYVRKNEHATGYGRKANYGARHANGKWLLFLNDDVFLAPDAVENLLREMRDGVAIVSHLLLYPNGTVNYGGKFRSPGGLGFGHIDLRAPKCRYGNPVEEESVCGASMLVRRSAFFDVNAFSELYRLYSEDDHLAMAIRQKRWKIIFTPWAIGQHIEHASTSITPGWMDIMNQSSRIFAQQWGWYFKKNANVRGIGSF